MRAKPANLTLASFVVIVVVITFWKQYQVSMKIVKLEKNIKNLQRELHIQQSKVIIHKSCGEASLLEQLTIECYVMFRSSHILVFWFLVALVAWFSFCFFPSCLAKCKQRLRNIFVTSSPKVTKNQKRKMARKKQ